jgi:phosphotransacetylase
MSDIQEEMKRLYMKAIEKDLERSSTNNLVVGRVIKQEEEINELQNRIDKAVEYINKFESIKAYYEYTDEDGYDEYNYDDDFKEDILNILKGDNK